MNAIELSHVTKHFPGFTLQDLSLTVPSGTICGLVGENGAGKSTTIRLLMGALRPDSGTCTVLGADSAAPEFLSLKEDIGVVLDDAYFPESLNALQVGGVMAKTYRRWDGKQYQNYLTRFGLPEKKPFKDFSRGMKMKLAIAVALSHSPRLLVLDEAGSAEELEMVDVGQLKKAVLERPAGCECVLTAHTPPQWMLDAADYSTEMKCHRHPYQKGIKARKGIEY